MEPWGGALALYPCGRRLQACTVRVGRLRGAEHQGAPAGADTAGPTDSAAGKTSRRATHRRAARGAARESLGTADPTPGRHAAAAYLDVSALADRGDRGADARSPRAAAAARRSAGASDDAAARHSMGGADLAGARAALAGPLAWLAALCRGGTAKSPRDGRAAPHTQAPRRDLAHAVGISLRHAG